MNDERPGNARIFLRGLSMRCPRCGSRHLFRHWFKMATTCPKCQLLFEREEGSFLGAYMINLAIDMGAILAVFVIGFATTVPDTPAVKLAIIAGAVSVLTPIVFYPFSKTIWCAIDMIMRHTMGEQFGGEGHQPGFRR